MCGFLYYIFIGARRTVFPGHLSVPHHPGERWRWCGWAQKVTRLREILCVHIVLTWWGGLSRGCPEVRLLTARGSGIRGEGCADLVSQSFSTQPWTPTGRILDQPLVPEMFAKGLLSRFCLCAQCFLDSHVGRGVRPEHNLLSVLDAASSQLPESLSLCLMWVVFLLTSTIS